MQYDTSVFTYSAGHLRLCPPALPLKHSHLGKSLPSEENKTFLPKSSGRNLTAALIRAEEKQSAKHSKLVLSAR